MTCADQVWDTDMTWVDERIVKYETGIPEVRVCWRFTYIAQAITTELSSVLLVVLFSSQFVFRARKVFFQFAVCFSSSECVFPARSVFFQLAACISGSQHGFKLVIQHAVDVWVFWATWNFLGILFLWTRSSWEFWGTWFYVFSMFLDFLNFFHISTFRFFGIFLFFSFYIQNRILPHQGVCSGFSTYILDTRLFE